MHTNLYTVGGIELSTLEMSIFTTMLEHEDHTYFPETGPDEPTRLALDMLVLEGLIERFKTIRGTWMNAWTITDGALEWLLDPEAQADLELVKSASPPCPRLDIPLANRP
tara:strand:+ start:2764 stop:3093 length:330 start_codon:yes stop_codon:yes gene_type:complete